MRIGICDDEIYIRELIESKIKKHYFNSEIVFFSSGEELLSSDRCIDILFLDIQMSGKNGMETARELRRKGKNTIIIFVTAIEEYVFQAFDVGAFHYLVKPIDDAKFASVLHRAVEEWNFKNNGVKESEDKYVMIHNSGLHTKVRLDEIIYKEKHRELCRINAINRHLAIKEEANRLRSLGDIFITINVRKAHSFMCGMDSTISFK